MTRKIRYIRLVDNADEVIDFLLLVILCGGIEGAKAPNGKMIDNDDINLLPPIAASDLLGKLNPDPDFLKISASTHKLRVKSLANTGRSMQTTLKTLKST